MDKNRLENGQIFDEEYFDHLISEIQEISASERRFYQKITDIYSTAVTLLLEDVICILNIASILGILLQRH